MELTTANQSNQLSTRLRTGKNQEIAKALTQEVKIKDLQSTEPIQQVLRYIFVLIGLKTMPNEAEKAVLIKFIQDTYWNYSPNEIKIAFESMLKNDSKGDLNHFQTFSALYLSKVMKAYENARKDVIEKLRRQKEKRDKETKPMTQEEIEQSNKSFDRNVILDAYNSYLKSGLIDFHHVPIGFIYETLEKRHCLIKVSKEEKKRLYEVHKEKVRQKIKKQIKSKSTSKAENDLKSKMKKILNGEDKKSGKQMIQESCRFSMVRDLFHFWKSKNEDVELILNLK